MSLRSRCEHRLWQSVLLVLGAGVLRIPTTSLRTGLGMTRKFFQPLSLRAGAHTGYPARNPSTNLRLVPLPLGKGGDGFSGVRWLTGGGVRAARPTKYRKRFGKAGRCRHRPLRRGRRNSSVIGRGRTPPLRMDERRYGGRTGVSAPAGGNKICGTNPGGWI